MKFIFCAYLFFLGPHYQFQNACEKFYITYLILKLYFYSIPSSRCLFYHIFILEDLLPPHQVFIGKESNLKFNIQSFSDHQLI